MDSVFPGFSYFVAIALFFFAFTTMLAYYYIAETNISYLTRNLKSPIYNHLLKVLMMVVIMYGSINQASLDIGDLGVGRLGLILYSSFYKTGIAGIEGLRKATESRKRSCFNPEDISVKCPYLEYDR
jgi:AGCS family alanine or glycine:cation symporter